MTTKRTLGTYSCGRCSKQFKRSDHLLRHKQIHDNSLRFSCTHCGKRFSRKDVRDKHTKIHNEEPKPNSASLSPTHLIEWLFTESPPSDMISPSNIFDQLNFSDFPEMLNQHIVDERKRQQLVSLIPSLELNPDFGLAQIENCIECYWLLYHSQYPILHRPSFNVSEAHPLLILAMVMMGATMRGAMGLSNLQNPIELSNQIAIPLRWLIFSSSEFQPPVQTWIIQSLVILESFEITSSSRFLHERAYLHHGTKIQLLRRSPILGGDPLKSPEEEEDLSDSEAKNSMWKKWIEVESAKRATLMAFYLDTVHATVYGHEIILYAHQIKLSLPCEDSLWESQASETTSRTAPVKFLTALKSLLHRKPVETSSFGRKILLAGLITVMFQTEQKDLQYSFNEWEKVKENWKVIISRAMDFWRSGIVDCCTSDVSLFRDSFGFPSQIPDCMSPADTRCKHFLYHIAQIYMRITHYDYIIYAGAPSRMNVKVTDHDYSIVAKRIQDWSHSHHGYVSVVYAYTFLFEMFLSHRENLPYDPNSDPFLHRPNVVASCVLVVWAFNFSRNGPQSKTVESGYAYLRRVKSFINVEGSTVEEMAERLGFVENSHSTVGLLKLVEAFFSRCAKWEIV